MDLRSGQSWWPLKNGLLASYPRLGADTTCEVAVIGGGITGALVAHRLTAAGVDVVLLDRRDVAAGSTAASTALLFHEVDTELRELIPRVGERHAVRAYRMGLEAVDEIETLCSELGDDCDFERKPSLYLARERRELRGLRAEFALRAGHGFEVEFLDARALRACSSLRASGAIRSNGNAQVDPFRLTHRLLQAAAAAGLRIYDRTEVVKIRRTRSGVRLKTSTGARVDARKLVFATGYESEHYLRRPIGTLYSSFVAASEPLPSFDGWPQRALIWEAARPYTYLRTTADGRALIGGGDVRFASAHRSDALLARKTKALTRAFGKLLPDLEFELAYAWAGTFGDSEDGLAHIGESAEWPGAYFAAGYGGNGITFGVIAARLLTDAYLGRDNLDAAIFRFER